MKSKIIIALFLIGLCQVGTYAQKKMDETLEKFSQTKFMTDFLTIREQATLSVQEIKTLEMDYPEEKIRNLKKAYNKCARKFNMLLTTVKQDLLDKKKMKLIASYPDTYAKGLEYDLRDAEDFYVEHFQQRAADMMGDQIDGSALLILLPEIINISKNLIDYFSGMKKEKRKFSASYLEGKLVNKNKFLLWDEIDDNAMLESNDYNSDDEDYDYDEEDNDY